MIPSLPAIPKTEVVTVDGRIIYALQPKQYSVYQLTPLYRQPRESYPGHIGCGGAAGGGKSYLSRTILAAVALQWPGSTAIIFRKTEGEIVANHVNKFLLECPSRPTGRQLYKFNGQDLVATWFNGSRTYFGYLRVDKDLETYQGPEYDVMIFEEATQYSDLHIRYLTGNRLRATVPMARPFVLYPSNPGNQWHYQYKRLFVDRRYRLEQGEFPENYAFVQMFLKDNLELTQRDPAYAARLNLLPEPWRSWQRDGNFSAGAGSVFHDLSREQHVVDQLEIPPHWPRFGSFDWGFHHPYSFGEWAVTEDGVLVKVNTIAGRLKQDRDIADHIVQSATDARAYGMVYAGHDCWSDIKSRSEHGPTTVDTFLGYNIGLVQANISRIAGCRQLRTLIQPTQPGGPRLLFLNTPGNLKCIEQLESRVADPDNIEDVLKTDADDFGEGGDDSYDETRYGAMSRYAPAVAPPDDAPWSAWDPAVLAAERERLTRGRGDHMLRRQAEQFDDAETE